jgi:hypothetical protein
MDVAGCQILQLIWDLGGWGILGHLPGVHEALLKFLYWMDVGEAIWCAGGVP